MSWWKATSTGSSWPGAAFGDAHPKADTRRTARAQRPLSGGMVELALPARSRPLEFHLQSGRSQRVSMQADSKNSSGILELLYWQQKYQVTELYEIKALFSVININCYADPCVRVNTVRAWRAREILYD